MKGWQDDTASLMEMEAADQEDESFRVCAKCLDTSVLKEKAQTQQVGHERHGAEASGRPGAGA